MTNIALVDDAAAPAAGSNIGPSLKDLNKVLTTLGADSVKSTLAKPRMAIAICRAAYEGIIGEDDATSTYETYLAGRKNVIAKNTMALGDEDKGSIKANVSKNLQIIKLGLLPKIDGPELLDRVTDIRTGMVGGDVKLKPTFDCFVDAARAQLAQPGEELRDDQIEALVRKAESKEKELLQKLIEDHKRMNKRLEELPSASIENCIRAIEDAMREINDGELPALSKEDKKAEKAMAFLRSTGRLS